MDILPKSFLKRLSLLLFLICFVLYNLNLRSISSGDTVPASLLPFSILIDRSITLDRFYEWYNANFPPPLYFFSIIKGHVYSSYPITLPVLITPLYLPFFALLKVYQWPVWKIIMLSRAMEKLTASLVASLSVVIFFMLLVKIVKNVRAALVLSVIYAFGTETWTISSQALWQHGMSELTIILGLYYVSHMFKQGSFLGALLGGLFSALSVAVRPTNIGFILACYVSLVLFLRKDPKQKFLLWYSIFPLAIALGVISYNYFIFGDIRGRYTQEFNMDLITGLAGVLISPSRGLLVYSPIFIFSAIGAYYWFKQGRKFIQPVYLVSILFIAWQILLISKWSAWYGGWCYGPRLLTDIVPCLTLLIIPSLDSINRSLLLKLTFICTLIFSIAVQIIGAFFYPNGNWDGIPVPVDKARVWDWKDNQIKRTVLAGPVLHVKVVKDIISLKIDKAFESRTLLLLKNIRYQQVVGLPDRLEHNSIVTGILTFINEGEAPIYNFDNRRPINVSYHWVDASTGKIVVFDGLRFPLPLRIVPQISYRVPLKILTPPETGKYILEISVVYETVTWLENQGVQPLRIQVEVE